MGPARQRADRRRDAPHVAAFDGIGEVDPRLAAPAAVLQFGDGIIDVAAVGGELFVQGLQVGPRTGGGRRRQPAHLGESRLDGGDGADQAAPRRPGRFGLTGRGVDRIGVVVLGHGVGGHDLLPRRLDASERRGEVAGGLYLRHGALGDHRDVGGDVMVERARVAGERRHHDHHDPAAQCDLRLD